MVVAIEASLTAPAKTGSLVSIFYLGALLASVYAFMEYRYAKLIDRLGKQLLGSLKWEISTTAVFIVSSSIWSLGRHAGKLDILTILQVFAFMKILYFAYSVMSNRRKPS
ncbi:MAG: hypothetical protein JWN01_848 [Patescibacteria group bacterium]|nr:hypothetical protein [Patescibacteria group bacterium]